jgi:hypothetical protein
MTPRPLLLNQNILNPMKPNHNSPSPILSIIPRLIIILIIRLKSPDKANPFIAVCPIDLDCVADVVVFSSEMSARVFDDVGFVAGGGAGDRGFVFYVVGPGPFELGVGGRGGGFGGEAAGTTLGHGGGGGDDGDGRDLIFVIGSDFS